MKLSEYSIKNLAKVVCGDCGYTPYLSGHNLVLFFNKYGSNDVYEQGFPSRWKYTEEKLMEQNGTINIKKIIEEIIDPRRFIGLQITIEDAIRNINDFLKYDKYELKKSGDYYNVSDFSGLIIEPETTKQINHTFVQEQIEKCFKKLLEGDYNGAITNARSLVEAILIEIIEIFENKEIKNDGDIDNLYKRVKKILNLEIDKNQMPDTIIQILSGLNSITSGLAGLSNNSADRHANKFKTEKHHAKLAINSAMVFCDFLLDSMNFQNDKIKKR